MGDFPRQTSMAGEIITETIARELIGSSIEGGAMWMITATMERGDL